MHQHGGPLPISQLGRITGGNHWGVCYKLVPPAAPKEDVEVGLEAYNVVQFCEGCWCPQLISGRDVPYQQWFGPGKGKTWALWGVVHLCWLHIKEPQVLGTAKGIQHTIDTSSAQQMEVPPQRVPIHKRQEMHSQVDEMLEAEIVEPYNSPWSFLVVLVAKPDGSQRFCVDYCALNSVTKWHLYLLPWCDDILESLSGAQWFSHLDLHRGYWQIDLAEEDQGKTVFATLDGQFSKLSFGLTNAPACFMTAMHRIFKGLCWSDCLVYLWYHCLWLNTKGA